MLKQLFLCNGHQIYLMFSITRYGKFPTFVMWIVCKNLILSRVWGYEHQIKIWESQFIHSLTLLDPTYILSAWDPRGGSFYDQIQMDYKQNYLSKFSTEVTHSAVKPAIWVRFPEEELVLKNFLLVSQFLWLNFLRKLKFLKNFD